MHHRGTVFWFIMSRPKGMLPVCCGPGCRLFSSLGWACRGCPQLLSWRCWFLAGLLLYQSLLSFAGLLYQSLLSLAGLLFPQLLVGLLPVGLLLPVRLLGFEVVSAVAEFALLELELTVLFGVEVLAAGFATPGELAPRSELFCSC